MLRWPQSVHSKGKNVSLGDNDSSELEVKNAASLFGLLTPELTDKEGNYGAGWGD